MVPYCSLSHYCFYLLVLALTLTLLLITNMNPARLPWKPLRENIVFKPLAKDKKRKLQIDLIKLKPRMALEKHLHPDTEWVYILQGSFRDEHGVYKKGDFLVNRKNSKHTVTVNPRGCTILCCWCGKIVPLKKQN